MNITQSVKRDYRSPLRTAQARATRRAILDAATRLFVGAGYGATSMDAIAEAAGVSRATVFTTFGTKPVLLKAAYDVALVGDDEPVALPDRADSRAIRAEPDPARYLDRYAGLVTELGGRVAAVYEAVRGAATSDSEVRPVWEQILAERRIGAAHVVADTQAKGPLRPDIDIEAAADVVVWCCDEAPGFVPTRPQDRAFVGNIVEAMLAYASGRLGEQPIAFGACDRMIAIGSDRMMGAVAAARHDELAPYLSPGHRAIGSINSPMQCMMKEICAQCLQPQRDRATGRTRYVFSCFNQDQPLDDVDFEALDARLHQNAVQEKLTARWVAQISPPANGD
jgi:AcrR family transcriptional regulator